MITYKRIMAKDNGMMQYAFYPEGDLSVPGIVEFAPGKHPKIINESANDVKRYYALHAMTGIDTAKESGTVAWY